MNWGTVPAILKGYFDKILIPGFAFTQQENFENGLLKVIHNILKNGIYFRDMVYLIQGTKHTC